MTTVNHLGDPVACEPEWTELSASAVGLDDDMRLMDAVRLFGRLVKAGEVVDNEGA